MTVDLGPIDLHDAHALRLAIARAHSLPFGTGRSGVVTTETYRARHEALATREAWDRVDAMLAYRIAQAERESA